MNSSIADVVIAFDFETATINDEFSYPIIATYSVNNHPTAIVGGDVIRQMLDSIIKQYPLNEDCTYKMQALNLSKYDGKFIIYWLINNQFKQKLNINNLKNNEFYVQKSQMTGIMLICFKYKNKTFYMKDFAKIIPTSIEKLGKMLHFEKQSGVELCYGKTIEEIVNKYGQSMLDKYVEYAKIDALILDKGINEKFGAINKEVKSPKIVSCAGISLKEFKKSLNPYKQKTKDYYVANKLMHPFFNIKKEDWIYKKHYCGGFTYLNPSFQNKKVDVYYYDINSSYPAIMQNPIAYLRVSESTKFNNNVEQLWCIRFKKCKLKEGCTPIIRHYIQKNIEIEFNNKIYYTKEVFAKEVNNLENNYYFWKEEIDWINKFYEIEIDIIQIYYYATKPFIKEFIDYYSQIKVEANKKRKDKDLSEDDKIYYDAMYGFSKIIQNSLYGKFASKTLYENVYYSPNIYQKNDVIPVDNDTFFVVKKIRSNPVLNHYEYVGWTLQDLINESNKEFENNSIVSSYITMKGRVKVYQMIEHIGVDNFVYCDTDSVVSLVEFDQKFIDANEYGKWKLEYGQKTTFKALAPKLYTNAVLNADKPLSKEQNLGFKTRGINKPIEGLIRKGVDPKQMSWEDINYGMEFESISVVEKKDQTPVFEKRNKFMFVNKKVKKR